MDCIRTYSGCYVNVFNPEPETINIFDIAHALSNMPRFAGHLPVFYSVAQHCVLGLKYVNYTNHMAWLLHDATEAYLMDLPRPIKMRMPEYKAIEARLMSLIYSRFNVVTPIDESIKVVDDIMLELEWNILMLEDLKPRHVLGHESLGPVVIDPWKPDLAKAMFLSEFYRIIDIKL